jgi:adenosylcobinamide kinase / adenosylcobinamide-phosphate guanylyltransferase
LSAVRQILIGGAVRCGKSAFALERARALGRRRAFIATAEALDDEMRARIARHRDERGGDFATIEEPLDLCAALCGLSGYDVVVIDCLTLWLSNLLVQGNSEAEIDARARALAALLAAAPFHSIVVTNEVGLGVIPESALGRVFRDVTGRAHQVLAGQADEIYAAVLGVLLRLHPSPIELVVRGGTA